MRSALKLVAAIGSIGAGIYLLTKHSIPVTLGGDTGQSWLEVIAHGIGVYFIAKGIWMASFMGEAEYSIEHLDRIIELLKDANENEVASGRANPTS